MVLDISAALRSPGSAIPFVHLEPLADTQVLGEVVSFKQPAVLKGTYSLVEEALVIKGQLSATAQAHCARCLAPVEYPVKVQVDESFLREDPRTPVEEDPWEERLVFSGHRVDLSQLIASLAVLELPLRFLCKQSCKSLPQGAEQAQDNKDSLDEEHPMSALRQLYTKIQEE